MSVKRLRIELLYLEVFFMGKRTVKLRVYFTPVGGNELCLSVVRAPFHK